MGELVDYSAVAASNNAAVPNGAPEGWFPPQVNNTLRESLARIRREQRDTNGAISCAGGTTAYTLSVFRDTVAAYAGETFKFKVNATNTGAVTINITPGAAGVQGAGAARGAVAVQKSTLALVAGDWIIGDIVTITHDGTQWQMGSPDRAVTGTGKHVRDTSPTISGPTVSGVAGFGNGAVGAPGISFSGDLDNGLYYIGTNNFAVAAAGAKVLEFAANGAILKALNPCVLARISSDVTDGTGDGTVVTLNFATEIVDRGGNLSGTTFTAPSTGIYRVSVIVPVSGIGASHTALVLTIVATSRSPMLANNTPVGATLITRQFFLGTTLLDMTAADTFTVTIAVSGSTKTVDILSDAQYLNLSVELVA